MSAEAAEITRASKSNLALAFVALDRERRRDITVFYAFCRVIDDVVDASTLDVDKKQRALNTWRAALRSPETNESELAPAIRRLIDKYKIDIALFDEIIAGVEMDLRISRYATFDELRLYCYRVASAVGLVSIEIFGCRDPQSKDYAINLGLALQMTNIIRDVARDLGPNRIYLPEEDLARFNYSERDLQDRQYDSRFIALMEFEADRAENFFAQARQALPAQDRQSLVAAEIMRSVYHAILQRMKRDRFRVFEKEYRLSKLEKISRIATELLKFYLNWW
ncbi:MAG: 15-cis-phytoene synthase [Verrucomicrobiota bacterium]